MPGVMNRYIKFEAAGDQYVGRCVSGRSRLSKTFAESLPYFDFSEFPQVAKERMMREQDEWIKERMSAAAAVNDSVFCLFKSCLASFLYHGDWLSSTIHRDSPLRCSVFWAEKHLFPHANYVTTRFPWTRTADTPQFTGIPVDVLYMAKIEELNKTIADLEGRLLRDNDRVIDTITAHVNTALDDRAVGGESYGVARSIDQKLDSLIEQMQREFSERVRDAARRYGEEDEPSEHCNAAELEEEVIEFTVEEVQVLEEQARDTAAKERSKELLERRKQNGLCVGVHKGILTPLLPDWKYPQKMTLEQLISLWLIGVKSEHVPPFRFISAAHVRHFDKDAKRYHDMKGCMKIIQKIAVKNSVWKPRMFSGEYWNGGTVRRLWDGICGEIIPHLQTVTKRDGEADSYHKSKPLCLTWRTAYTKLKKSTVLHD